MLVRVFLGLVAGANAPLVINFASPFSAALFLSGLIILAGSRCFHVLIGILLGMVLLGASFAAWEDDQLSLSLEGDSLVVTCTVAGFPVESASGSRFDARCISSVPLPRRIRLSWFNPPVQLRPGDRWQFEVRLRRAAGLMNPGGFDAEKAAAITGIGATGYIVDGIRNRLLESGDGFIERLRMHALSRIQESLPWRDSAAVITALGIGSRHAMTDAQWQRYAASGTTHLVAISGLHIGLAALIGAVLTRVVAGSLRLKLNHRRLAMMVAFVTAVFYTALSGFGIPAQRACLMLLVVMTAWATARETNGFHVLAVAGMIVLSLDPLSAYSAGFALSFLAVATLIWIAIRRSLTPPATLPALVMHRAGQLVFVQSGLFVMLLWVTAAHFGSVSLTAPLLNLVAVPLFSALTVPTTLLSLLAPFGDSIALPIAAWSVEWLDAMASRAGKAMPVSMSNSVSFAAATGVAAWIILPRGFPGRGVALACLLPLLFPVADRTGDGCVRTTFLDVGQGTAVLVETKRHRLLYDTGPAFRGGRSAADSTILPYLAASGIDSIDRLVVSHADLDHSGGLTALKKSLAISSILAGEALDGDDWTYCHGDQAWVWDGVRFEVLLPVVVGEASGNDASCVLRVSLGEQVALLTGDIEANAERELLKRHRTPVSLLSVPHHGSRTSSTPTLVATLSPSFAVISAGYRNRWKLPDPAIVQRWEDQGTVVLNTADEGAIGIEICRGRDPVLAFRHRRDNLKRWHREPPRDPASRTENF